MNKKYLSLISLIAGGLYILAFSPMQQYWLGFVVPALLLYCWKNASNKQAFYYGWLFGLGAFGFGTSWVYISIHNFGNTHAILAGLITLLFTLLMSLYPALQGFYWRKLFAKKTPFVQYIIAFPILWVFFEWLRSWLFSGFPWLMLGYTQSNSIFNAYAAIIGVYGISWLVAVISGAIILLLSKVRRHIKIRALLIIFAIVVTALIFYHHNWTQKTAKPLSVAIIQGNTPQKIKWDADYISHNIQRYVDSTAQHLDYQLIVWPEAAIPLLAQQVPDLITHLDTLASQHNSAIIFGIPGTDAEEIRYYNTMRVVGNGNGNYQKRHLVPFGEYTPLESVFDPVMKYFHIPLSSLTAGDQQQADFIAQGIRIAPFICYEIVYPAMALESIKNTQLVVVVNDDSWFGNSLASAQQIQMAQMRALETGRYIVYASNTGITAIISPMGQLTAVAPERVFTVLTGEVYAMQGNTALMYYGYYPLLILLIVLLLIALTRKPQKIY